MPLWGSVDNAANSDIAALIQVGRPTNSANQTILYGNTRPNTFMTSADGNVVVGQFGVDTNEIRASNQAGAGHAQHAGWVLRHEGRGLKAGRVWYETLVAMGSLSGDGSDDTYFPDRTIVISTQPSNNTGSGNVTFTVVADTVPSGGVLSYKWQRSYAGALSWADIPNTAGVWFGNTSITLTANAAVANANTLRCVISNTGANTVFTTNVTVTKA